MMLLKTIVILQPIFVQIQSIPFVMELYITSPTLEKNNAAIGQF